MTALLVMQLRDEGRLRLSDRLDSHLPGSAYGDRTLVSLLSHSGGLQAEPPGDWWERSPGVSNEELQTRLADADGVLPNGRRYHYSNLGFALLGELVATLRGAAWAEVLHERLLAPLGMTATGVSPGPGAAHGFSVDPFTRMLGDQPAHDSRAMAPAGQVWSTLRDLARYAAFLARPDDAVLDPASLEEMTVVRTGDPDDVIESSYGLGLRLAVDAGKTYVGHTGSMPGFLAGLFVDRSSGRAAVCLANATNGMRCQALPIAMLQTLDECEPSPPKPWVPAAAPSRAVVAVLGTWFWGSTGFVATVDPTCEPGGFALSGLGGQVWCRFRPEGDDFVGTNGYLLAERLRVSRWAHEDVSGGPRSAERLECATFTFTRRPR